MTTKCWPVLLAALGVAFVANTTLAAQPEPARQAAIAPATERVSQQPATAQTARRRPYEPWRYRFHNGHWWYWLPSNHWAYWTGAGWQNYEPNAYARWHLEQLKAKYRAEVAQFEALRAAQAMDGYPQDLGTYSADYGYPVLYYGGGWGGGVFGSPSYLQQGDLNIATSVGGYMGGALRGPAGY